MAGERTLYRPKPVEGDIPAEEIEYVELFVALERLTEKTGNAERVVLLLSTCRNIWMTINAVFVDIKETLGYHHRYDRFSELLFELGRGQERKATEIRREISAALGEAGEKVEVWEMRSELMAALETGIEEEPAVSRSRLHQMMGRQRQRRPMPNGAHGQFLVLDIDTAPARAQELLGTLVASRKRLLAISDVASRLAPIAAALSPLLEGDQDLEGTIFATEPEALGPDIRERVADAWPELAAAVAKSAEELPQLAGVVDMTAVLKVDHLDLEELQEKFSGVLAALAESVRSEQDLLDKEFQGNIASAPMPAPFKIDLTRAAVDGSGRGRGFEVVTVNADAFQERDTARIALLSCGLPESAYSHVDPTDYSYDEQSAMRDQVIEAAKAAISAAAGADCVLLAMPEVFLPRTHIGEMADLAADAGISLVTGVEYRRGRDHMKAVNEVLVALPGVSGREWPRKQRPSVYEVRRGDFEEDGILRLFRHTVVGNLGVIVCSDYLEFDILTTLADVPERLDTLIVVARNPVPTVFEILARADAARLYASVVVVNARPDKGTGEERKLSSGIGTVVAVPTKDGLLTPTGDGVALPTPWDGDEGPTLKLFDLPLAAVRSRDRGKPADGFLPPPFYARRVRK